MIVNTELFLFVAGFVLLTACTRERMNIALLLYPTTPLLVVATCGTGLFMMIRLFCGWPPQVEYALSGTASHPSACLAFIVCGACVTLSVIEAQR